MSVSSLFLALVSIDGLSMQSLLGSVGKLIVSSTLEVSSTFTYKIMTNLLLPLSASHFFLQSDHLRRIVLDILKPPSLEYRE